MRLMRSTEAAPQCRWFGIPRFDGVPGPGTPSQGPGPQAAGVRAGAVPCHARVPCPSGGQLRRLWLSAVTRHRHLSMLNEKMVACVTQSFSARLSPFLPPLPLNVSCAFNSFLANHNVLHHFPLQFPRKCQEIENKMPVHIVTSTPKSPNQSNSNPRSENEYNLLNPRSENECNLFRNQVHCNVASVIISLFCLRLSS
jgi:hypothetical protein